MRSRQHESKRVGTYDAVRKRHTNEKTNKPLSSDGDDVPGLAPFEDLEQISLGVDIFVVDSDNDISKLPSGAAAVVSPKHKAHARNFNDERERDREREQRDQNLVSNLRHSSNTFDKHRYATVWEECRPVIQVPP